MKLTSPGAHAGEVVAANAENILPVPTDAEDAEGYADEQLAEWAIAYGVGDPPPSRDSDADPAAAAAIIINTYLSRSIFLISSCLSA